MKEHSDKPRAASGEEIRAKIVNKNLHNINIFTFAQTDSTNTRAKEFAKNATSRESAVFIADAQTCGRGRMGRSFVSRDGAGLFISFLIYPDETFGSGAVRITAYAAVKACEAIEKKTGLCPKIKWVNDLYLSDRKLAGILTEGEVLQDGKFSYAVVGIGINLFDVSLGDELDGITTNIEKECAKRIDKNALAAALIDEFFTPDPSFMAKYRDKSLVLGEKITVTRISGEKFVANAVGITESGALLVEYNGIREELISAEVSIRKFAEE